MADPDPINEAAKSLVTGATGGGGVAMLLNWLRGREAKEQAVAIGVLQAQVKDLQEEVRRLRDRQHQFANDLTVHMARGEVSGSHRTEPT